MRQWVPTRCQRTNLQVEPCGVAGWPHQGLLLGACGLTALSRRSKSRPEYWGGFQVSALCQIWCSESCILPLGNTGARFPGNLEQSKCSPRHKSQRSVAGGHRGEFRGRKDKRKIKSFFCSQVHIFPNPLQLLHERL